MLFRGTLRSISNIEGLGRFLSKERILLKDFGDFAQSVSEGLKKQAEAIAQSHGRPYQYLNSAQDSKDEIARGIAEKDDIQEGLICVLTAVEPCWSFGIVKDRKMEQLRLESRWRKCLHVYFYYIDPEFGLMHVRIQTWLPIGIQVYVNGREWLARQMDQEGIGYEQHDNCFTRIEDLEKAQQILNRLEERGWAKMLNRFAEGVNPYLNKKSRVWFRPYYWTLSQAEYATDVMFGSRENLQKIYPRLVHHAIEHFHSEDVLRFLGRKRPQQFSGKAHSNLERRVEGVRVKHWIEKNSIKMYDKAGCILRVETTINNPRWFKVYRRVRRRGHLVMDWIPMRKGVADVRRRVEISRAANYRYLEALAVVGETKPSHQILDPLTNPVRRNERRFRPLHAIDPREHAFFQAILRGEHAMSGVRNKDICKHLGLHRLADPIQRRRASAHVTRRLSLYRAHGLLKKVSKTHYYRPTQKGYDVMSTAIQFRITDVALLCSLAKTLC
jgi:hypothetical protein